MAQRYRIGCVQSILFLASWVRTLNMAIFLELFINRFSWTYAFFFSFRRRLLFDHLVPNPYWCELARDLLDLILAFEVILKESSNLNSC